jgi:FKBP-type peptidyl-prolyl cis-trans isomerase FklB
MKRIILFVAVLAVAQISFGQVKKPVVKKPVAAVSPMKTLLDSASYTMGMSFATFYKQQGISKVNIALVTRAISEVMSGKKTLLDDQQANVVMNDYMAKVQAQQSKGAIDSGIAFLKANKTKPGVHTTASGLQYEVITEGTGEHPSKTDSVTCHYRGTLLNGTPFDDSYSRGTPITFALRGVIAGWTEALQLMSVGSKYKLYVPYQLAYGASDYGPIPGGSALVFEVELLAIKKMPAQ